MGQCAAQENQAGGDPVDRRRDIGQQFGADEADGDGQHSVGDDDKDMFQHVAVPAFRLNGDERGKSARKVLKYG
jgi:hypothetical protein